MTNELMFKEIMQMPCEKTNSIVFALDKMFKYCKDIKLLTTEKNDVYYQVKANVIKELDLDNSELLALNQNGWVLSKNGEFLEFFI